MYNVVKTTFFLSLVVGESIRDGSEIAAFLRLGAPRLASDQIVLENVDLIIFLKTKMMSFCVYRAW